MIFKNAPYLMGLLALFSPYTRALLPVTTMARSSSCCRRTTTSLFEGENNIERLEFKIYPDGRVEEKVLGVKGGECLKITERINKALGQVISSEPTEEMFEQEVKVDQTLKNVENGSVGDSWEGASSW